MRDVATMLSTELVLIDAASTANDLTDRLRWNHAYYRLAHGIPGVR